MKSEQAVLPNTCLEVEEEQEEQEEEEDDDDDDDDDKIKLLGESSEECICI
jgi:hypothetical protein